MPKKIKDVDDNNSGTPDSELDSGKNWKYDLHDTVLIRGILLQRSSAGAKKFTNYVFCYPQFSGVIQNIENRCAILTPICLCQLLSK